MGDEVIADLGVGPPGAPEVTDDGGAEEEAPRGWADRLLGRGGGDEAPPAAAPAEIVAPPLTEEDVAAAVEGLAGVLAVMFPDEDVPDLWLPTDAELRQITRYLTRIAARRPAVAAVIERGDGLFLTLALGEYVARNMGEKTAARAAREDRRWPDAADQPEAGRDAGRADAAPAGDADGRQRVGGPRDITWGDAGPPAGGVPPAAP